MKPPRSIIIALTADAFGVAPDEVRSKSQRHDLCQARHAACLVMRDFGYTFDEIGDAVRRDGTTALYSVRRGVSMMESSWFSVKVEHVHKQLKAHA